MEHELEHIQQDEDEDEDRTERKGAFGECEEEEEHVRGQIESVSGICKRLDACGQPEDILWEFCKPTYYLAVREESMLLVSSF